MKRLITFNLVIGWIPCAFAKDQVVRFGDALGYMVPEVPTRISWDCDDMVGNMMFWHIYGPTFVAYSRFHGDEQGWSDVLGGAILGITSAIFYLI